MTGRDEAMKKRAESVAPQAGPLVWRSIKNMTKNVILSVAKNLDSSPPARLRMTKKYVLLIKEHNTNPLPQGDFRSSLNLTSPYRMLIIRTKRGKKAFYTFFGYGLFGDG